MLRLVLAGPSHFYCDPEIVMKQSDFGSCDFGKTFHHEIQSPISCTENHDDVSGPRSHRGNHDDVSDHDITARAHALAFLLHACRIPTQACSPLSDWIPHHRHKSTAQFSQNRHVDSVYDSRPATRGRLMSRGNLGQRSGGPRHARGLAATARAATPRRRSSTRSAPCCGSLGSPCESAEKERAVCTPSGFLTCDQRKSGMPAAGAATSSGTQPRSSAST